MKKYLKNVLWLLFFVCVAALAYTNMNYEDIVPQRVEHEIKHVQM